MASNDNRSVGKPGTNQAFMGARSVPVQHDKPRINDQRKVRQHAAGDPPMGIRPSGGKTTNPKEPRLNTDYMELRDVPIKSIHEAELAEWNPFSRLYNSREPITGDAIAYNRSQEGIRLYHVRDGHIVAQTDLHDSYQSLTDKIRGEKQDLMHLRAERAAMSINPHKVAKMKAYDYARQLGVKPVKVGQLHSEIPVHGPGAAAPASPAAASPGASPAAASPGASPAAASPGAAPAAPGTGSPTGGWERPTGRPTPDARTPTDRPISTRMGKKPGWAAINSAPKPPVERPMPPMRSSAPAPMPTEAPMGSMGSPAAEEEPTAPKSPEGSSSGYVDHGSGGPTPDEMKGLLSKVGYDEKTLNDMTHYQLERAFMKIRGGGESPRMKKTVKNDRTTAMRAAMRAKADSDPTRLAAESAIREGWRHQAKVEEQDRIPVKQVIAQIRQMGMKCRWDGDSEEFRVNFPAGGEESAYYTPWADDAIGTAKDMADRMRQQYDKLHPPAQHGAPMHEGYPDTSFERDEPAHESRIGNLSHEVIPHDPTLPDLNREFAQFCDLNIQRVHEQADREISAMLDRTMKRFGIKPMSEMSQSMPAQPQLPGRSKGAIVRERRRWV